MGNDKRARSDGQIAAEKPTQKLAEAYSKSSYEGRKHRFDLAIPYVLVKLKRVLFCRQNELNPERDL
jgi:hypothetical protein